MTDAIYLVFLATSRQGRGTIKALEAEGVTSIVGTSRNPESKSSESLMASNPAVKQVLKADLNDRQSLVNAIQESKANRVWFTTDMAGSRDAEFETGKNVIDAIKECTSQIDYVVYNSVGDADEAPEKIGHFSGKADIEKYMESEFESTKTKWAVVRPVAFLDNLDDAFLGRLKKGGVKFLTYENYPVKFISTEDVGKAAAVFLLNPWKYAGMKLEAASCEHDGIQLAKALSEASGVDCKYTVALPRFLVWLLKREIYHMVTWFETDGFSADIEEFKKIVPDAMDAKAFFISKGQWADGEKFVPKE